MSVEKLTRKDGTVRYRVRWRDGAGARSRVFDRSADAVKYDTEVRRLRQLGGLAQLDAGAETLDAYVSKTWAPTYAHALAPSTRKSYAIVYDRHIAPYLGHLALRAITVETVARWQAERLAGGTGPHAMRRAMAVLSGVLQRAVEAQRLSHNPVRSTRKATLPRRAEVRPLTPETVETMRTVLEHRDATLVAVLAYAGLRPGEALALEWGHVLEDRLVVNATKTGQRRAVRLLAPLASDLREWRLASGRPAADRLVFPSRGGQRWTQEAQKSWARHAFRRAAVAAGAPDATPYALRHSYVSLLLAEGRTALYVAAQAGHSPTMTLDVYGHLFAEYEDRGRVDAEALVRAARESRGVRLVSADRARAAPQRR